LGRFVFIAMSPDHFMYHADGRESGALSACMGMICCARGENIESNIIWLVFILPRAGS